MNSIIIYVYLISVSFSSIKLDGTEIHQKAINSEKIEVFLGLNVWISYRVPHVFFVFLG